jgi:hypothetical protein
MVTVSSNASGTLHVPVTYQDEQARQQHALHAEPTGYARRDRRKQAESQEGQRREKPCYPVGYAGIRPDLADQGGHAGECRAQVGRQQHDPQYKEKAAEA